MKIVTKNSPNQSDRIHGQKAVKLIVCHTPEGPYEAVVNFITNSSSNVSYHRLYRKNGLEATQLVPFEKKAWHAGAVNSISEGLAIEGHARTFDLSDPGTRQFARGIAERLVARGLKPNWTTDVAKGGFCRHGDLQADRSDPTSDMNEWRLFVSMVKHEYELLTRPGGKWPKPIPNWFWKWARWRLGVTEYRRFGPRKGPRPKSTPRIIPPWAWRRYRAIVKNRKD